MNGEMGDFPSATDTPILTPRSEYGRKHQYAEFPENFIAGPYSEDAKSLVSDTLPRMMEIPTITGDNADFLLPWIPWIASIDSNFIFIVLFLHYCPQTVYNFRGDGNGGHMSPMAC